MNLSGMIIGRMEQRRGEMGIRKSFGAQRSGLLWQVLVENFLLTMIGAAIGLVVSWVLVYVARDVVFSLIDPDMEIGSDTQLSMETYFSPGIFAIALGVTLILNLLSSYIPAWWSLRHPIVKSLNEHR